MSALLERAVELAVRNVESGGGPFGAVIETVDGRIFQGQNRVTANRDPSAHAEVMAIRHACQGVGSHDLSGAVLFTSCYPCPMCLTTAMWARVGKIVYAASPDDAAAAGFDDRRFYNVLSKMSSSPAELIEGEADRLAPFQAWQDSRNRVPY